MKEASEMVAGSKWKNFIRRISEYIFQREIQEPVSVRSSKPCSQLRSMTELGKTTMATSLAILQVFSLLYPVKDGEQRWVVMIVVSPRIAATCLVFPTTHELDTLWRREARSSSDSGNLTCKLPLSHRTRHSLESREEEQGREREIERGEARSSSDSGNLSSQRESNQRMKRTTWRKKSRVLRSPFAELPDKTMMKRSCKESSVRFSSKKKGCLVKI